MAPQPLPAPYATMAYATAYFNRRLHVEPWSSASPADKQKALIMSSDAVDRLAFRGVKTDPLQLREFPRDYPTGNFNADGSTEYSQMNVLPDDILKAVCENALALLDGVDPEAEYSNARMQESKFAGATSKYQTDVERPHILCGLAAFTAYKYIRPYVADKDRIQLVRVS